MSTQVNATFVNGMLKPDHDLSLADQTRVKLTIEPIEEWSPEAAEVPSCSPTTTGGSQGAL